MDYNEVALTAGDHDYPPTNEEEIEEKVEEKAVTPENGACEEVEKPRNRCSILDKSIQAKLQIDIGTRHQAELPEFSQRRDINYEDRDDTLWKNQANSKNDPNELEEFTDVMNSVDLGMDQVLELLFKSNASLRESLDQLDNFLLTSQGHKWSKEEQNTFVSLLNKNGKNFAKIARMLDARTTKECVEMYYKLKMKRCLTSSSASFAQCPSIQIFPSHGKNCIHKSNCQNCTEELWRSLPNIWAPLENYRLCPPCQFYAKKYRVHRPWARTNKNHDCDDMITHEEKLEEHNCIFTRSGRDNKIQGDTSKMKFGNILPFIKERENDADAMDYYLENRIKYRLDLVTASIGATIIGPCPKRILPVRGAKNPEPDNLNQE